MAFTQSHRTNYNNPGAYRCDQQRLLVEKIKSISAVPKNTLLVEHALVINLPQSRERLSQFLSNNKFDGTTEIIEGIDGMTLTYTNMLSKWKGDSGCLASHRKALIYARDKNWPCVMIFEDDIAFVDGFNEKLKAAMLQMPESWGALWLGGKDRYPNGQYTSMLSINNGMWGAYAFVIRQNLYQKFIDLFAEDKLSTDDYFSREHKHLNAFKTVPDLCLHVGYHSDRVLINHIMLNATN